MTKPKIVFKPENNSSSSVEKAIKLYNRIKDNRELTDLEINGFIQGATKRKTIDISMIDIYLSVHKQYLDFAQEALNSLPDIKKNSAILKQKLADLRNNAGLMFIKLQDEDKKNKFVNNKKKIIVHSNRKTKGGEKMSENEESKQQKKEKKVVIKRDPIVIVDE